MVMARLHIICGNCGSNDMFTHTVSEDYIDPEDSITGPCVYLKCGNCATLHDLDDNAPSETKKEILNNADDG